MCGMVILGVGKIGVTAIIEVEEVGVVLPIFNTN